MTQWTVWKLERLTGKHRRTIYRLEKLKKIPTPRRDPSSKFRIYSEEDVNEIMDYFHLPRVSFSRAHDAQSHRT